MGKELPQLFFSSMPDILLGQERPSEEFQDVLIHRPGLCEATVPERVQRGGLRRCFGGKR